MEREALWASFAARHAEALYEAAERKERVYRENPALGRLDQEITEAGARYCAAMAKGEDTQEAKRALDALEQKRAALLSAAHADLEPHFRCPLCRDTGMGPEGICDCFRRELIAENFKQANLEQGLCRQSFEQFDFSLFDPAPLGGMLSPRDNMKKLYRLCRDYVAQFEGQEKSLLFVGATGLGKTYLSTAVARALLERGKSVIYISAPEFARRIETTRFKNGDTQMEQFFTADMLILDDLGTENRTPYIVATLTDLMDQRIRNRRPMLFSTNLNLEGIQKAYDERIVSRLIGHFTYCFFYGEDLRVKASKEGG